jgi:hypothetical protein
LHNLEPVHGELPITQPLAIRIGPDNVVPPVNYVRLKIIDDFQIQVKWTSEGQRPVEAPLQLDPAWEQSFRSREQVKTGRRRILNNFERNSPSGSTALTIRHAQAVTTPSGPNSLARTSRPTLHTSVRIHAKMHRAHRRRSDGLEAARDETLVWSWWREPTWDGTLFASQVVR